MGLALSDLLTAETLATIRARIAAQLAADGFPTASWAPSAVGGVENISLDMAAGGVGVYMSPRIKNIVTGRLLPLAADDERGPWLSALGARFYGLTKRPATKTVQNVALYAVGSGGTYTFSPGDLWVRSDSTGNRYVNITGGSFSPQNTGPPGPGLNPLMLQFEAEAAGSSYSDGPGTVATLVTARAGVRCINVAPSDYLPTAVSGPSTGTITAAAAGPSPPASIRVAVRASGEVGTALFSYSLDGGVTWVDLAPLTSPSLALGDALLSFAAGATSPSFIQGDVFTMLLADAILQRGNDAESDAAFRRRCANRWPSLSSVPVAATIELWAQQASPEITRIAVDADPVVQGGIRVTLASSSGPATPAAQIAVEDYINARLLGYKGVPAPATPGYTSPAESAIVVSAVAFTVTAGGVVRVPKAQLAQAQIDANVAWNAYLAGVPVGGQAGAVVELARLAQILADAGAVDVPGAISQLTLNGTSADLTVPAGQVSVPPAGTSLLSLITWVPA